MSIASPSHHSSSFLQFLFLVLLCMFLYFCFVYLFYDNFVFIICYAFALIMFARIALHFIQVLNIPSGFVSLFYFILHNFCLFLLFRRKLPWETLKKIGQKHNIFIIFYVIKRFFFSSFYRNSKGNAMLCLD